MSDTQNFFLLIGGFSDNSETRLHASGNTGEVCPASSAPTFCIKLPCKCAVPSRHGFKWQTPRSSSISKRLRNTPELSVAEPAMTTGKREGEGKKNRHRTTPTCYLSKWTGAGMQTEYAHQHSKFKTGWSPGLLTWPESPTLANARDARL